MRRATTAIFTVVSIVLLVVASPAAAQTPQPQDAYQIYICHGPTDGSQCAETEPKNEPNEEHAIHVLVVDSQNRPVPNVVVQFRETGPGIFIPQGGSSTSLVTDANGYAAVVLTSDVEGTSTVVVEIKTDGAACHSGGQCISQTITKIWEEIPDCDDGEDNDEDGLFDEDDGGCLDGLDLSERIQSTRDRRISIRFNDGTGARNNGLLVFGRLRAPDFPDCRSGQPVNVQRRVSGRWVTEKRTKTNRRGRYAVEIFDLASRYRAVAPERRIEDADADTLDICELIFKAGAP